MKKDEALALALEALEKHGVAPKDWACKESVPFSDILKDGFQCKYHEAITAIKQARSAPVQKPYRPLQDNGSQYFGDSWDTLPTQSAPVQPVPCCGKYETCTQACTPRGKFLGARDAAAQPAPTVQEPARKEVYGDSDSYGTGGSYAVGGCYGPAAFTDGDRDGY